MARHSVMEEDNDLYCTSYSDGIFTVKLVPSDICTKCNLEAKTYLLHLTATDLQLKSAADDTNTIIVKWPYRYIRKYGYRDGKFTFEAGRKCDTGEGVFSLEHSNPQELFRCMGAKMKSMKKLISGDSVASIDCGEHQFNAALSMEAGSRSPLPPSPNHNSSDVELNHSSHLLRGFLSSNDSLNNVSTSSSSIPLIKHIPSKPPRKSISDRLENTTITTTTADRTFESRLIPASSLKYNKLQNYEIVTPPLSSSAANENLNCKTGTISLKSPPASDANKSIVNLIIAADSSDEKPPELPVRNESKICDDRDYECIETITNAWKTMGIDEVKHTEHVSTPEDTPAEFVWQRSQSHRDIRNDRKLLSTVKIDVDKSSGSTIDTPDVYDRLQFFASNSKTSGDYKTIVTVTPPGYMKQTSQPITSNDYEIIGGGPDIQSCRLADDSYMGYGVLRKPLTTSSQSHSAAVVTSTSNNTLLVDEELLDHRKFNGLDYAIVSKPKRV